MENYNNEKVLLGLSGGINSAGILCWLKEQGISPGELHIYYAHFKEHSPDTFRFVADQIRFARLHFKNVTVKITRNSIINYFAEQKIIPHPKVSPCSKDLKIVPMMQYAFENDIKIDLIGYVKHEMSKRANRQEKHIQADLFSAEKHYVISEMTDEWCFEIVKRNIGWYPKIYDFKDEKGKRVFLHNNCLPCKNMTIKQMEAVKQHFPEYHNDAMELSKYLDSYWGRVEDDFYFTFGRDLGQESTCTNCKW